ncbi:MAG: sulfite exporter TauE/SafE family protein [Halieaceae bacterium]|nr:sulfite exporter TauE/SafE family protein [Halieaceae bacterium]
MPDSPLASVLAGIVGAIFANSTGAGGGVVFVPLFRSLGLADGEAVATSFAIQSFGMSTGAIAWTLHYLRHRSSLEWDAFASSLAIAVPCSIVGLWSTTAAGVAAPAGVSLSFAVFSLLLGTAILSLSIGERKRLRHHLRPIDRLALVLVSVLGGVVTAWLSVGVGEFVAFYLIARRYDVTEAVGIAVVVSALTVWSAAPIHLFGGSSQTVWAIALWAGPGAVGGALIARALALRLGALRLKRFFGGWLVLIGLAEFFRT